MNIAVVGTGYVGLVTGVCLAEIGHQVICIDIDKEKIEKMKQGITPIYEPGIEELMKKNINNKMIDFTNDHKKGFAGTDIIMIAVGTPQKTDGSADLSFIEQTAKDIAHNITSDVIVVTKSTVPVGTNEYIKDVIQKNSNQNIQVQIVSNPEFLREGSAIFDTFHGDRIVIGAENEEIALIIEKMYQPFNVPVFKTDLRSAEMIKYASNAFLATKISFINEMANLSEKLGANIDDVATGMGKDQRIGSRFLNAGIGFGGSCFPKDTSALLKMGKDHSYDLKILQSVLQVNDYQKKLLVQKALKRFGDLQGLRIALLGLAFKPNTDDLREAASIVVAEELLDHGAEIVAYDPIAIPYARKALNPKIRYENSVKEAIQQADCAFILTEWEEIKKFNLANFSRLMKQPILFDGRNCFRLKNVQKYDIEYHSIGRPVVYTSKKRNEN